VLASTPDLLRLVAVPVFAWAAYRDTNTRRVPNRTWYPLVAVGALTLAWDAWLVLDGDAFGQQLFLVRVAVSLGLVAPMGYVFWRLGGFGGADAKALMALSVLYPVFPVFYLSSGAYPAVRPTLEVFSLTILTNTVVLGLGYPLVLAATNLVRGRLSPAMFVGRPIRSRLATEEYGRLLETTDGLTRRGLDLDALRMYLRWRGTSLAAVRTHPERFRDPAGLPDDRFAPTDGALTDGGNELAEPEAPEEPADRREPAEVDEWGAATFLAEIEGSAYGTTPEALRAGLEVLATEEEVWLTPGVPFIVPMFFGLVLGLTYGDLLFGLLVALGLA
jgi:preflagellin peptidase FlaK